MARHHGRTGWSTNSPCRCSRSRSARASGCSAWTSCPPGLKLMKSQPYPTGVIVVNYVPAGDVKTGNFQLDEPSDAELKRRLTGTVRSDCAAPLRVRLESVSRRSLWPLPPRSHCRTGHTR